MQKIERLIPCSAFVLQEFKNAPNGSDVLYTMVNYATFLQRALELWMFVPCGDDNKPLSEPDVQCLRSGTCQCGEEQVSDCRDWKYEYRKAKERCLFEGFELMDNQLIFEGDTFWSTLEGHCVSGTIEDISHIQIPLTATTLKEIYGS